MKKITVILAIIAVLVSSCAVSNKTTKSADYVAEEVELVGYGQGESSDWNTAQGIAQTQALKNLSIKLGSAVRTASSNYQKQSGNYNKTLYESLTEVVSEQNLEGVVYKGDSRETFYRNGKYMFRVEARVNHTILRKNIERVLEELDATDEEREAFRREMFGANN